MPFTVTPEWKIVVKGTDNRYHEVIVDPQSDYGHARALAMAYTGLDPDRPDFVPDARVIREGAVVGLLDALRALVKDRTPMTLHDAKVAIQAATNPDFDIELKVEAITLDTIRETGLRGAEAYHAGKQRADVPSFESETLEVAWLRGWEGAALQSRPKGPQDSTRQLPPKGQ